MSNLKNSSRSQYCDLYNNNKRLI